MFPSDPYNPIVIDVSYGSANFTGQGEFHGWDFSKLPVLERVEEELLLSASGERNTSLAKNYLSEFGFAIMNVENILSKSTDPSMAVTQLLSRFGKPIRVFRKQTTLWRKIDVDLERPKNSSRGTGYIPIHMDFVNASNPPDLVALICLIEDPLGGGRSILSDTHDIISELSEESRRILFSYEFNEGRVESLDHVGDHIKFSVLSANSLRPCRYTEKLLQQNCPPNVFNALTEMQYILLKRARRFLLKKNHLLIMDQRRIIHGRESLGINQSKISIKRLLMQLFLRYE